MVFFSNSRIYTVIKIIKKYGSGIITGMCLCYWTHSHMLEFSVQFLHSKFVIAHKRGMKNK